MCADNNTLPDMAKPLNVCRQQYFTRYGEATKCDAHSQGGGSRNSRLGVSHYEEEDGLHAETATVE